ncbi:PH domain-containing protein [Microbacterium sp. C7(2022)]|uniref:PH domain-containing protein n=1 Tax=Microbacterium sp. C7(2022) TaxID=2992759 RepID=UPI00237C4473|nr:PH domain-containing protein [Microbacterium sp. C7(2022)]MDE0545728.1 PH domain-containing protein [Microbacterium sp. C7(2022)]
MPEAHVLRPRFGRVLAACVIAICGAAAVTMIVQSPEIGLRALPMLGLLAFAAWAAYWRPSVRIDDDAVSVENIFRTITVPYGNIQRIDTRFALTLFTETQRVTAWSAPAPGRHRLLLAQREQGRHLPESSYLAGTVRPGDLVNSDSGAAAYLVRRRWEQLRDTDMLDTHAGRLHTRVHTGTIIVGVVLLAALAISLFI